MGKNDGPIWSRLWTKVHDISIQWRRPFVVVNARANYVYNVSFGRYRLLKLPLSCEVVGKTLFLDPHLQGKGYSRFRTCIFKSHLLPTMWPDMVECRSASSETRGQKEERKNRGKPKSVDKYARRPKISLLTVYEILNLYKILFY